MHVHNIFLTAALLVVYSAAQNVSASLAVNATATTVVQLPNNATKALKPLYQPYSRKTPKFNNETLIQALSSPNTASNLLLKRATDDLPVGACAPGVPCTNGACCSNTGVCSYAPSSCGTDVCISNCDAKAPCGQYADPENAMCPLNVCCSQFGFCKYLDTT